MMVISAVKRVILLCTVLCAGCEFPPQEVDSIREQLQAQLSRGQVYVMHSDNVLSYVIRNSEFNRASEEERGKLVSSVEKETLVFLAKYRNYKYIRIYFLGHGTAGINSPYMCRTTFKACMKTEGQE
jgi:hypothetical protein